MYHKKFNFNSTPIAPLGSKAVSFIAPDDRNTWQPHAFDTWYTGPAPDHYRLLEFYNPRTGGMLHTGTYQIFPAHCAIPTISEGDLTIAAAADLMRELRATIPTTTQQKVRHAEALRDLTNILNNGRAPRVDQQGPPRVKTQSAPRVVTGGSTADPTNPATLRTTKRVHQRKTRNNTPISATHDVPHSPPTTRARAKPAAPSPPRRTRSSTATRKPTTAEQPDKPSQKAERPKRKRTTRRQVRFLVDEQLKQDERNGIHLQNRRQTPSSAQCATARPIERAARHQHPSPQRTMRERTRKSETHHHNQQHRGGRRD